jgi:hypothetical protein
VSREGSRHWWWHWRFRGKGALGSFSSLSCLGVLAVAMVAVTFGHVGVVDRAVVPEVGVPLWQYAVGVMTVNVWGRAPTTLMAHS